MGLADETGDDAHDGRDDLEQHAHGLLNGLAVLIDRRIQIPHIQGIGAAAPGKEPGCPHHCGSNEPEDDKEDYARNNRGGENTAVINGAKPPPIRVHTHEHGSEE